MERETTMSTLETRTQTAETSKAKPPVGVLLLNLGTPDSPEPKAVGRYLKQFLMDRWVIDIPWLLRWFLVHVMIVPKRKYASAEAYQSIWTQEGSPLLTYTQNLTNRVRAHLSAKDLSDRGGNASGYRVEMAMRYGNPSVRSGIEALQNAGCEEILALPLYPQYAESSTRTCEEECRRQAKALNFEGRLHFLKAFYDDRGYIEASTELVRAVWEATKPTEKPDYLLFSFHGLPERHVQRTDRSGEAYGDGQFCKGKHCLVATDCCARITEANRDCYRAHCFTTARAIASSLNLKPEQYSVSFQSRLGRTPWIRPYTDEMYVELAKRGVRRLAVATPSFTADCLETIEEIGIRGRDDFRAAGGEELFRIPCLNAEPRWVQAVVDMIEREQKSLSPART